MAAAGCGISGNPNNGHDGAGGGDLEGSVVEGGAGDMIDCVARPVSCGQCATDQDCPGATPRCNGNKHVCQPCLPFNDNCPLGQVCTVEGDGYGCLPACQSDCSKIGPGGQCCDRACHDTNTEMMHCGACDTPCVVASAASACVAGKCTIVSCNAGYSDCDRIGATGCEAHLSSDSANCGACGVVCPAIANSVGCENSVCNPACRPGYADCNKDLSDGCEVDLTFDVQSCGACGAVVPPAANATPFCSNGTPGFRCVGHFFDCDGDPKNGCELDAGSDPDNCGHCGSTCPRPANAAPICQNAQCGLVCNKGFGDCDHNAEDGCEASLLTDLENCGGCAKACHGANGKASCAAGVCTLSCNAGFADCNHDPSDGCESAPASDAKNCGACGNVCPMNAASCIGGKCVVGCLAGKTPPASCDVGVDPQTGASFVVCSADCSGAWISSTKGGGQYHALELCNGYGYSKLGEFGGSCGAVCGHCGAGSCAKNGTKFFDGVGDGCGKDNFGVVLCVAVQWTCLP